MLLPPKVGGYLPRSALRQAVAWHWGSWPDSSLSRYFRELRCSRCPLSPGRPSDPAALEATGVPPNLGSSYPLLAGASPGKQSGAAAVNRTQKLIDIRTRHLDKAYIKMLYLEHFVLVPTDTFRAMTSSSSIPRRTGLLLANYLGTEGQEVEVSAPKRPTSTH